MLTARSPMRSRSVLILSAATIRRRSAAMGCCRASRLMANSSISISMCVDARLVAEDFFGGAAVLLRDGADAALNGGFDQRAHLEQLGLQLF